MSEVTSYPRSMQKMTSVSVHHQANQSKCYIRIDQGVITFMRFDVSGLPYAKREELRSNLFNALRAIQGAPND